MSNAASAWRHFAISSDHAQQNCGPRRLSGSSAENTCAIWPSGHSSRFRDGSQVGRSCQPCTASSPETPSIITSRTSCSVSPISAICAGFFGCERRQPQRLRTHPFGACAGFAGAAAADYQPGMPGLAVGCESGRGLVSVSEEFPTFNQEVYLPQFHFLQQLDLYFLGDNSSQSLRKPSTEFFKVSGASRDHPAASLLFVGTKLAHLGQRARETRQRPRAALGFGALPGLDMMAADDDFDLR